MTVANRDEELVDNQLQPEQKLTTTVIVTAYAVERLPGLRRCLDGVLTNDRPADEIILSVDNNAAVERVATAEYGGRGIRVMASTGRGAVDARNTGVAAASGDLIVFIDDDVRPTDGWLAAIVAPFENDPGIVAVGGRILPEYEAGAREVPPELLWLVGCTYAGHPEGPGPISRPIGSTMAFRRSALDAVGGFSNAFGPVGGKKSGANEELAISEKLREEFGTSSIWYQPEALVYHWVPRSRLTWRYIARRSLVEGQSKAEIRRLYGSLSMGYDSSYVTRTLIPGVSGRLVRGPRPEAFTLVGVGAVTAGGYAGRRLKHLTHR
ncbi:MAG TPA: glycosyltransferase family 2 protein [Acidimicrobiales bacterium]|nr:glycosyltransferase family 2 protein [Acidimicrobiales bacterium]